MDWILSKYVCKNALKIIMGIMWIINAIQLAQIHSLQMKI